MCKRDRGEIDSVCVCNIVWGREVWDVYVCLWKIGKEGEGEGEGDEESVYLIES